MNYSAVMTEKHLPFLSASGLDQIKITDCSIPFIFYFDKQFKLSVKLIS